MLLSNVLDTNGEGVGGGGPFMLLSNVLDTNGGWCGGGGKENSSVVSHTQSLQKSCSPYPPPPPVGGDTPSHTLPTASPLTVGIFF